MRKAVHRSPTNWRTIEAITHDDPNERIALQMDAFVVSRLYFGPLKGAVLEDVKEYLVELMADQLENGENFFKDAVMNYLLNATRFEEEDIEGVFDQMVFRARFQSGSAYDRDTVEAEITRISPYQIGIEEENVRAYPEHEVNYLRTASKALKDIASWPVTFKKERELMLNLDKSIRAKTRELYLAQLDFLEKQWEKNIISLSDFMSELSVAYLQSGYSAFEMDFNLAKQQGEN